MRTALVVLMMMVVAPTLSSADLQGVSYIGIRLGAGHTTQDSPDEQYSDYTINADQTGFYTEAFYNWHFLNELALEVGLAAISRGEFRWVVSEVGNFFGTINLYPITVGLKIKPLASQLSQIYQPWLAGGGSLVVGRALIDGGSVSDPYVYISRSAESETALGWWLGAGFDSFISSVICLSSSFKYQKMEFNEPVGGYLDHSGHQISFGIAYIFRKK